jgi:hypothetical protein
MQVWHDIWVDDRSMSQVFPVVIPAFAEYTELSQLPAHLTRES